MQDSEPPTARQALQHKLLPTTSGVCSRCVCVHCCVCTLMGKCRGRIPSMDHHTWLYVTSHIYMYIYVKQNITHIIYIHTQKHKIQCLLMLHFIFFPSDCFHHIQQQQPINLIFSTHFNPHIINVLHSYNNSLSHIKLRRFRHFFQ